MPAPLNAATPPTSASHYEIAKHAIPTWLQEAGRDTHATLRAAGAAMPQWYIKGRQTMPDVVEQLAAAYSDYRFCTGQVDEIFTLLPTPEAFAKPKLEAELQRRFGLDLDTAATYLFHASHAVVDNSFASASKDPVVQLQNARKAATSTLLQAAMQNFEAADTVAGGLDDGHIRAGLYSHYPLDGLAIRGTRLSLEPHAFAGLCRDLDLGKQYQEHLNLVLQWPQRREDAPGTGRQQVAARVKRLEQSRLRLYAHIALLKGDIDRDVHRQLSTLTAESSYTHFHHLSLFDAPLTDVMVIIHPRGTDEGPEPVTAYLPGDPVAALKTYPSRLALMHALRDRLLEPAYQRFFATRVPARQRNALFSRLNATLYPKTWNSTQGWYEVKRDNKAAIHLSTTAFDTYWLEALHDRKLATLRDDARFHLVATAEQDRKSREARLQYFEDKLFDALNVAAFVVPGLGEVMLAVTAAQLCYSTYEGFDALVKGDQDAAFGYLMGVVDNLAMIALMAGAGAGVGGSLPGVEPPEVVKAMRPVTLPDGSQRLWKPDLAPFHHDVLLPPTLRPNALGLYEHGGKLWLAKDGRTYNVKPPEGDGPYRLRHPRRPDAYEPPVRSNGKGAWLDELDRPQEWEGRDLFRRLGPMADGIDDQVAARILRVSDTHEAVLRRTLAQGEPPPALLEDTLQRFRLDQQLGTFIEQLESATPVTDSALQWQLLTEAPGWPQGRSLEWVNAQGEPLGRFGPSVETGTRIRVEQGPGDPLPSVLAQLSEAEIKALLQEDSNVGPLSSAVRSRALREQLARRARHNRTQLFEQRYQAWQRGSEPLATLIQAAFEGLPRSVAEELATHATAQERAHLQTEGKVPPRLAAEARAYLANVRLVRAYEGLYLDTPANPDAETVKLHSIEALPGWSPQVRIQVREGTFTGPLVDQAGGDNASIDKVLIRNGDRYETRDNDNRHLHGEDTVYGAVLHALPDTQRAELGFPHVGQQQPLRHTVRQAPLLPRHKVREWLHMGADTPGGKSPMGLADGRTGMALQAPARAGRIITEDSLLDKLRVLELESALDARAPVLLEELYGAGLSRETIDERLNALLDEQAQLRTALDEWVLESASITRLDDLRVGSRQRIGDALWHCWRRGALGESPRVSHELRLESVYLADFPRDLPAFLLERVQRLNLRDLHLNTDAPPALATMEANQLETAVQAETDAVGSFLARFPRVTAFSLQGHESLSFAWFRDWPNMIAQQYPGLTELRLVDLRLPVHPGTLQALRGLRQLRRLDLSGNPVYGSLDLSGMHLDYLGMDRTADQWSAVRPNWFAPEVLDHTAELSLRGNHLTELPAEVLANPTGATRRTRLVVRENNLPRDVMITARMSERPDSRYTFDPDLSEETLRRLLEDNRQLEKALDDWQATSSSAATIDTARQARRASTAQAISSYWRTYSIEGSAPFLNLEGAALADFPTSLPDTFYQNVRHVTVSNTNATTAQINSFLRRLPNVQSLAFTGHARAMSELPAALLDLPALRTLSLSDQGLVIDQAAIDFFARLPALETLILNRNTLGTISNARGLAARHMAWLSLDSTGISQWPQWLNDLIPNRLERVGLEGNQLTELPEHILANHRSDTGHTILELRNNPLTHDTMRRAHVSESYYRPYAFDMDLPDDILNLSQSDAHSSDTELSTEASHSPHSPGLHAEADAQVASVEPWLAGDVEAQAKRRSTWASIADGNDAGQLLNLIDRLRQTADFRRLSTRGELIERVWAVLQQAATDVELRLLLNGMAEEPLQQILAHDTCPDGIRLAFNQMEIQVFTRQSMVGIPEGQRGQTLHRLVQQLYRSQELDRFAIEQAGARDQAEVRLAYRLRLAQELDLPLPPGRMLYEGTADLRPNELEEARRHVQRGEQGESFLRYAAERDFWQAYLRDVYTSRFAELKADYEAKVLKLTEDSPVESVDQLSDRITALETQWHENERQLLMDLTAQEGRRYA